MRFDQADHDIRCEWGERGVGALGPVSDVVIIVDVLSFSTAVGTAVGRGARVYPFAWRDRDRVKTFAQSIGAIAAGPRGKARFSLSPLSLCELPEGARVVLPSPNGSTLSLATGQTLTLLGCLRNSAAVAAVARSVAKRIAVIPAGERWKGDRMIRFAIEDLLGAGAILSHLEGRRSPEAQAAADAFAAAREALAARLQASGSGKELSACGFEADVAYSAELDVSRSVPVLRDGAFEAYAQPEG